MSPLERLARSTLMIVPIVAVWLLVYLAAFLISEEAALPGAILRVLAISIVVGVLPRSFLRPPLDRMARSASLGRAGVLKMLGLVAPSLLITFAILAGYSHWNFRRFATEYGLQPSLPALAVPLCATAAVAGVAILIVNVAILVRSSAERD